MRRDVFVAYSSDARPFAQRLCARLEAAGVSVFLDEKALPEGEGYDRAIRSAIEACTAFLFVVSPGSVASDAYALTELRWAAQARRRLHAVYADVAEPPPLPAELEAVTVPRPHGDPIAAVVMRVADAVLAQHARARRRRWLGGAALLGVALALVPLVMQRDPFESGAKSASTVDHPMPASAVPARRAIDDPALRGLSTGRHVRLTTEPGAHAITVSWHDLGVRQFRRYDCESSAWHVLPALATEASPDYLAVLALGQRQLLTLWARRGAQSGMYASRYAGQWTNASRIAAFAREDSDWILRADAAGNENRARVAWTESIPGSERLVRTLHFDGHSWSAPQEVARVPNPVQARVAMLESGHSLVAWPEETSSGRAARILAQLYAPDGAAAGAVEPVVTSPERWSSTLLGLATGAGDRVELLYRSPGGAFTCGFTLRAGWEPCAVVVPEYVEGPVLSTGATDGVVWYNQTLGAAHVGAATRIASGSWVASNLEAPTVAHPEPAIATAGRAVHALWVGHESKPRELGYIGWSRFSPDTGWSETQRIADVPDRFPFAVQAAGTERGGALLVVSYDAQSPAAGVQPSLSHRAVFVVP